MSEAAIAEYRTKMGLSSHPRTKTLPVLQGGCPRCGHPVYDLSGLDFCPCEDCHSGGYVVRPEVLLGTKSA